MFESRTEEIFKTTAEIYKNVNQKEYRYKGNITS
jgi:hypothetical protein